MYKEDNLFIKYLAPLYRFFKKILVHYNYRKKGSVSDMDIYKIIIIIFGVITFILLSILFFVNRISLYIKRIERSFIPIVNILEEYKNTLKKVIDILNSDLLHEDALKKEIEEIEEELENVNNAIKGIPILTKLDKIDKKILYLENIYPKLKNDKEYIDIKENIERKNDKINYSIEAYHKEVEDYNRYKENKIVVLLNKIFSWKEYQYYNKKL